MKKYIKISYACFIMIRIYFTLHFLPKTCFQPVVFPKISEIKFYFSSLILLYSHWFYFTVTDFTLQSLIFQNANLELCPQGSLPLAGLDTLLHHWSLSMSWSRISVAWKVPIHWKCHFLPMNTFHCCFPNFKTRTHWPLTNSNLC